MTTQAALASKEIKVLLKKTFPNAKFQVRSQHYAGGNSVSIVFDGEMENQAVWDLVKDYQYGHFDGMTDSYEASNCIDGKPQVTFVHVRKIRK